MATETFARNMHGDVVLDICWDCRAIWFDKFESTQLAPAAVIALFRRIHEHREQITQAYADIMRCPRCDATLVLTHDRLRNNRIRYHRCPKGHGRLTAFMQFLREKEFVRTLSATEIETLKATVSQVRCSSCGAVINLERDAACGYCRSPLAILDATAVEKSLAALVEIERKRAEPSTADIAAAMIAMNPERSAVTRDRLWGLELTRATASPDIVDLVISGIGYIFDRRR